MHALIFIALQTCELNFNEIFDLKGGLRRNQVLIFGVILLGILAICLAVSMPSDLEFHDTELPTASGSMSTDVNDRPPLPNVVTTGKRNQTNSTTRKKALRNSEVSVEVKLLRDMAIHRKIQEYDHNSNNIQGERLSMLHQEESPVARSKEEKEHVKVNSIVETFIRSDDYEDFLIDMEIHDAVRKLREEKGYKNRPSSIFDELFKRAEKEFIGDDEEELRLIRRVGEELERRARDTINERKKTQGQELTEPKKLLADELLKLDFSGSGDSDSADDDLKDEVEMTKTEL